MAGPLACLLSAALTLPVLLAWLLAASRPAEAQTLNRLPTWAVVSFVNNTGYGGGEVGIEAADGFVVELGKSNKYDVLPRAQTQQAIADLGLVEPLDKTGLQKLARSLEGDAVATGEVAGVSFNNNPRRASVTLIIRVVDRVSGELINGAVARGVSTPRPAGFSDDDALVNEAISKADFEAVRQISAFNLPRATVLIHGDPTHVTLNKGSQEGLYNGLSMVVTRNGAEVGRIRVSSVEPDEADATVTDQGLGINTQDIATAIYQLPAISSGQNGDIQVGASNHDISSTNTGGGSARGFFSGPIGAILAGAVGVGIFALASGGRGGTSSGNNAIGGGRLGGQAAARTFAGVSGITAPSENFINSSSFLPEAIQITWNNGNLEGASILEYHVFRDPEPAILANAALFQTPTAITAQFGALPIVSPASPTGTFDSIQDVGPIFIKIPDPTSNTNAPLSGDFYGTAVDSTGKTIAGQFPVVNTGLLFGDRPRYRIEALYTIPNLTSVPVTGGTTGTGTTGTGTTTTTTTLVYSLSEPVYTNYVSYLQPVVLSEQNAAGYPHVTPGTILTTTPDNDVFGLSTGPDNVIVVFRSVYLNSGGGLKYVLDFSTDPTFRSNVHRYSEVGPAQAGFETNPRGIGTSAVVEFPGTINSAGVAVPSGTINLISAFGANPGNLYVRVGVRDTLDSETDSSYVYSTEDRSPLHQPDPVTQTYLLPSGLTPGGGATGAARARAVAALQAKALGVQLHPSSITRLHQTPASRPAVAPSATLHPSASIQRTRPAAPPRSAAPVRPSISGH